MLQKKKITFRSTPNAEFDVIHLYLFCIAAGRKHDSGLLADSGLQPVLEQHAVSPAGHPMCLYGDPAYPLRVHLQAPFRNVNLTPQMMAFNKCMSEVRVSVEWMFGDIANHFKFMDFKVTLCNNFTLFEVWFYRQLVLVPSSNSF